MFRLGNFQVVDRDGVTNGRTKFISVLTEVTKMEPTIALQCVTKSFESLTYNRTSRAASSQLKRLMRLHTNRETEPPKNL